MKISHADERLLSVLREDARASTAQIARRLGLSRTTVQSRIDRLEQQGVIAGYSSVVGSANSAAVSALVKALSAAGKKGEAKQEGTAVLAAFM